MEPPIPVKPALSNPIQQSAMSGRSAADVFAESGGKVTPEANAGGFEGDLKAAQARDKGAAAAPAAAKVETPATAPLTPPKVPGLPQPEEWKPKGEGAKQWNALKTKHSEELGRFKADVERLTAELNTAKATGSPDAEAIRKELKEYKELLRDVAIERDPEFKQVYSARESAAVEAATLAAGEKADKLAALLKAPNSQWKDEQINSLLESLPASSQRRINAALSVIEQIDVERTSEIARRRVNFDQKQSALSTQREAQQKEMQGQMLAEFDKTQKQWTERHPFFTKRDGDTEHNAAVDQSIELAKSIFSGQLSPQELSAASFWAASGERVLKGWQTAVAERDAALAQLDKIRGVQPGEGRAGSPGAEEGSQAPPAPGSVEYIRYMNAGLREAQAKDATSRRGL